MPTAATITLADSVPTNRNFDPQSITPQRSVFVYRGGTTSAGNDQLILEFSPANAGRSTNRVGVRLNCPVEQTVDGVVQIAYTPRFQGSFTLPDQMTALEKADFMAFVANAMAHATIQGYVKDEDPVY